MRIRVKDGKRVITLEQGEVTRLTKAIATVKELGNEAKDQSALCASVVTQLTQIIEYFTPVKEKTK